MITTTRLLAATGRGLLARARPRPGRRSPRSPRPDAGITTTEYVILTALLVAATITVAGILVAKLTARANSISL